ncbi:hypothetical protein H632_c596p0 [Helicosporidium sp. ATCC 50920]|nr:hypothetical protein H632_c596p0 [Helicosporidium sp. ATCC 50920]|eukprot:KDD75606.1 hypothetical protein H632_c596p0 [Helicosporidium sp. ATCC 50920]
MFPGNNRVKYGLTVPINRSQAGAPGPSRARAPPAAFGEQSSEEEDVEAQIGRHAARKQTDRQTAKLQAAALAEDASIFDYDSHFDALQESRQQDAAAKAKASKSSRYVASLLERADERKREQDFLKERQMLRERDAEEYVYGTSERFVTAAYKKKLEEDRVYEAAQKEKQREEEANAVEKKGHMHDFYRNIHRNEALGGRSESTARADPNKRKEASRFGEGTQSSSHKVQDSKPPSTSPRARSPSRQEQQDACSRDKKRDDDAPKRSAAANDDSEQLERAQPDKGESDDQQNFAAAGPAPEQASGARRNTEDAVAAARARYMARKKAKLARR